MNTKQIDTRKERSEGKQSGKRKILCQMQLMKSSKREKGKDFGEQKSNVRFSAWMSWK